MYFPTVGAAATASTRDRFLERLYCHHSLPALGQEDSQGSFVLEAARALRRQGVQPRVVAMHSPGIQSHEWLDGIEVFRPHYWCPERSEILRKEGSGGIPAVWRKYRAARLQLLPFLLVHTAAVARYPRGADLIHAHWTLSGAAACLARPVHHRPILVTLHGSDVFRVLPYRGGAWFTRTVLRQCDRVMAVSRALAQPVAAFLPPERLQVIPDGVDTRFFAPLPGNAREDLIVFAGSLIERKGVRYLLAAMPAILRRFPSYRLAVLGDGPQQPLLQALAADLEVAGQVDFLSFQAASQVSKWMQRAKVLVLPSLEEGLGVVLLEALASGTPVVGSAVDGIPGGDHSRGR